MGVMLWAALPAFRPPPGLWPACGCHVRYPPATGSARGLGVPHALAFEMLNKGEHCHGSSAKAVLLVFGAAFAFFVTVRAAFLDNRQPAGRVSLSSRNDCPKGSSYQPGQRRRAVVKTMFG
jgi:hypothetical protein